MSKGKKQIINQSIIVWTLKTKSLLPSLTKGRNYPSLVAGPRGPLARRAKRGEGRFSEAYVFFIMNSLVMLNFEVKISTFALWI